MSRLTTAIGWVSWLFLPTSIVGRPRICRRLLGNRLRRISLVVLTVPGADHGDYAEIVVLAVLKDVSEEAWRADQHAWGSSLFKK